MPYNPKWSVPQRCLSVMLVQLRHFVPLSKEKENKMSRDWTKSSKQTKEVHCTWRRHQKCEHIKRHTLAHAQVLYWYMCMHCPHAYFKRCFPCPSSPHQRKRLLSLQWHAHIHIKLFRQSIRTSKTPKNECKLLITTLLSGIVGKSGALTTFPFLLDLGTFNILPCSPP